MVDAIMNVERLPISRWTTRQGGLEAAKKAWMGIRTSLATLDSRLEALASPSAFSMKTAVSSNDQVVVATASTQAVTGGYQIVVNEIARAHVIASDTVASSSNPLGLTGTFGLNGVNVTVEAGDSINSIAAKINARNAGATASVIDGRLVIKAQKTGVSNSIVLADDSVTHVLVNLGLLALSGGVKVIKNELIKATNARFTLDGLAIERASNQVSDVLVGVSITLKGQGSSSLTVAANHDYAISAIKGFVDAYNSLMTKISMEKGPDGVLRGDPALSRIESGLRSLAMAPLKNPSGLYSSLYQIGVSTTSASATLQVNETVLTSALASNPVDVKALFIGPSQGVEGLTELLRARVRQFIDGQTGSISLRNDRLDREIADLKRRIIDLEMRLEKREKHLVQRFVAMETALNQLNAQGRWLEMWNRSAAQGAQGQSHLKR
jgi:flagellar hook-associated protein 2